MTLCFRFVALSVLTVQFHVTLLEAESPNDTQLLLFGASFGRTGTTSTRAALAQLGVGPTYHMEDVIENNLVGAWADIFDASTEKERHSLLREKLHGYEAAIDFPVCSFYKDLLVMYPDAKVLLTTRDPVSWANSAWDTIFLMKRFSILSQDTFSSWRGPALWAFLNFTPKGNDFKRMLANFFGSAKEKKEYVNL